MKLSLRTKTVILLLVIALLLSATAVTISYTVYKNTMENQYRTMTENLAHTESVTLNKEALASLTDQVMGIYRQQAADYGGSLPFDDFDDEDWETYFAAFDSVTATNEFSVTYKILNDIANANDVASIYICYMDVETNKAVYIIDASNEDACLPGTCDDIEPANLEAIKAGNYDFPAYITNYPEYGWLSSAAAGTFDDEGNIIADAYVDISMDDVVADRIEFLRHLTLLLLVITVVAVICSIIIVDRNIVLPIKRLAKITGSFVEDNYSGEQNFSSDLTIKSKDEIGELYASVEKMHVDIQDYMINLTMMTAEKERIGAELNVATKIQADMLPSIFPAFPERKEFDVYASMTPAKEVGGDFYDFFLVDDDHLAMVIGDVSGKGVPAALFMVISKTLLQDRAQMVSSPKTVLETVNNILCDNNTTGLFVTVWLGIMEISTGKVIAANAGHEFPAICNADGSFELIKDRHGFVLAGMEDSRYREYEFTVEEGGTLFVYTDGVAEATSAQNELFGTDRMLDALNINPQGTPKELNDSVLHKIDEFVGKAPQFDDITILCLKRNKVSGTEEAQA